MMLRIIVRTVDIQCLLHTGEGKASQDFKTFDLNDLELEAFLRKNLPSGVDRSVIGVEVLPEEAPEPRP